MGAILPHYVATGSMRMLGVAISDMPIELISNSTYLQKSVLPTAVRAVVALYAYARQDSRNSSSTALIAGASSSISCRV